MANRFGITAADVAARLNNLLINDRSTPTIETVDEMIEEATVFLLVRQVWYCLLRLEEYLVIV